MASYPSGSAFLLLNPGLSSAVDNNCDVKRQYPWSITYI